ncbi:GNAT family N-acetyltransferase [Paenibacillus sp. NPDC057934]|uniref:GNAT family N-acetyltransferase n=1 Tax=Paenibacillus sp. NPDC057934 TaxID=3346282 RepID=UPI0036DC571D
MNLRPLKNKDSALMIEWMKDPKVNQYFRFDPDKMTTEAINLFIQNSVDDDTNIHLAIVNEEDEYLGTVSLKNIDHVAKTGEYAIVLRSSSQGMGAGKFATESILSLAFNELQLERVYLNVLSDNLNAIEFYHKIGFVFEGEFYNHLSIRGSLKSLKWYRMMRCEYDSRKA